MSFLFVPCSAQYMHQSAIISYSTTLNKASDKLPEAEFPVRGTNELQILDSLGESKYNNHWTLR